MTAKHVSETLRDLANPNVAEHSQRFFKTGKGQYGEGDRFLGIRVPILRTQAKQFRDLPLKEVRSLMKSAFHEERLCALLILVLKFAKGDEEERTTIYSLYVKNTKYINNWDLVDSSAHQIVGGYLADKDKRLLYTFAQSKSLWERRIAIIATYHFLKKDQYKDALSISKSLLKDDEDLIHKAVGWMLREIGKRDLATEETFLKAHYKQMPRTMLRYAIEKFPERERKRYLNGLA